MLTDVSTTRAEAIITLIVIIIISIFNINFITVILIMVNGYSHSLKLSHPMSAHMYQLLV